jgi:hypothetical protein
VSLTRPSYPARRFPRHRNGLLCDAEPLSS